MKLLEEKVAIVTGGGTGFGRATSLLYAKEGAKVVVADINTENGEDTVREIEKIGAQAIFVKCDISKAEDNEMLVDQAVKAFGKLDIAFNNAGILGVSAPIGEYPIDAWDNIISVNLSSVFYGMRYQIPQMLKNGGGVIVNTASILGQVGFEDICGYVASKHGVVGLTRNVAIEYGQQGIRANAVAPAFVETNLTRKLTSDKEMNSYLVSKHPMGRLGKVEEVANLVLWLSSDKASFCNGGYYAVDGGYLAK